MGLKESTSKSKDILQDKGNKSVNGQRNRIGYIFCGILFLFLITFNLLYGEPATLHAITALFWAFLAADYYERYRSTKIKLNLINTIVFSIAAFMSTLNYILRTLK
ncbi:DUF6442 family protein [Alloiococcus sp. CFN-8]|uniref:DUF6442 family protein n=1 Tax=Alloiococcus sp. CFN-8 TaxID=3416081 RepID=UPI003CEE5978